MKSVVEPILSHQEAAAKLDIFCASILRQFYNRVYQLTIRHTHALARVAPSLLKNPKLKATITSLIHHPFYRHSHRAMAQQPGPTRNRNCGMEKTDIKSICPSL